MTTTTPTKPPITTRFKLLYGMGDLSLSAPLTLVAFFQLIFLTDVAGMNPAQAGTAVLIGKIWDAFNDPVMGFVSDRVNTRWGRRRGLLLFGAIPFGLTFIMQFVVPSLPTGVAQLVYYSIAIILFDTAYTVVHVAFNALTPAISSDYDEQSSINGFRMGYSIGGGLFAVILATIIAGLVPNPRTQYFVIAVIMAVLAIIPIFVAFSVTAPYDDPNEVDLEDALSFTEMITTTLGNRAFRLLMGLYLFSWTTASLIASVLVFFANYYMNVPDQANFFVLASQLSAILFLPFWIWISGKYDKRKAFIWGSLSWIVILIGLMLMTPELLIPTYILAFLGGAGVSTAYLLPWSMIPDVVEMDELETGQRREAAYYAFAAFFQKLGTGLAIWAFGQALGLFNYISPEPGSGILPVQPPEAIQAIRFSIGLVPAVLLVLAVICAWYYPITREKHEEIQLALAEKQLASGD
ncbi:MAG: glycoside-pentoside-hexuronide (GPH):cation symporter [Chloroflexota bacterium]